jgi:flagellar assembly protein FliH
MDALIRAARLSPAPTRLSQLRSPAGDALVSDPRGALLTLRKQIEAELREQLKAECEREHRRAYDEGYATGLAAARAAATDELARIQQQWSTQTEDALSLLERAHQAALSRIETSVGEVAFAALCRLVGREIASETFVIALVKQACAQLRADTAVTMKVHPRDMQRLSDLLADGESRLQSLALKLAADESLALGGCVIETAGGQYDGGLENQLRRLHDALTTLHASAVEC